MRKMLLLATITLLPVILLFGAANVMARHSLAAEDLLMRPRAEDTDAPSAPPDLSPSVKLVTPTALLAGETLSYTIVLSNSGDLSATVALTDTLPLSTTYLVGSLSATGGTAEYSATVRTVFWEGVVSATEAVNISFGVMVSPSVPGGTLITNTATFSHDAAVYERDAVATVIPTAADLTPSQKTVTPTELFAGENAAYTIVLENSGETTAETFLSDFLPSETSYVPGSLSASSGTVIYNPVQRAIFWDGDVAYGTPVSITFGVVVAAGTPGGSMITNTAEFSHDGIDYERSAALTITPTPADLSLSQKTVTPTTVLAGDELHYVISLQNSGETAAGVELTDTLPISTSYVAGSLAASSGSAYFWPPSRTIFWLGDVAMDAPVSITFSVDTDPGIISGTLITNTAAYSHDELLFEVSAAADVIEPVPIDLSASLKTVEPVGVLPGGVLSYTIVLQNAGYETATVYLTDTIPISTTYVLGSLNASSGTPTYDAVEDTVYWQGDIVSGGTVTITFQVAVSEALILGDPIINTARFSAGDLMYERSASAKVAHWFYLPLIVRELNVAP